MPTEGHRCRGDGHRRKAPRGDLARLLPWQCAIPAVEPDPDRSYGFNESFYTMKNPDLFRIEARDASFSWDRSWQAPLLPVMVLNNSVLGTAAVAHGWRSFCWVSRRSAARQGLPLRGPHRYRRRMCISLFRHPIPGWMLLHTDWDRLPWMRADCVHHILAINRLCGLAPWKSLTNTPSCLSARTAGMKSLSPATRTAMPWIACLAMLVGLFISTPKRISTLFCSNFGRPD